MIRSCFFCWPKSGLRVLTVIDPSMGEVYRGSCVAGEDGCRAIVGGEPVCSPKAVSGADGGSGADAADAFSVYPVNRVAANPER